MKQFECQFHGCCELAEFVCEEDDQLFCSDHHRVHHALPGNHGTTQLFQELTDTEKQEVLKTSEILRKAAQEATSLELSDLQSQLRALREDIAKLEQECGANIQEVIVAGQSKVADLQQVMKTGGAIFINEHSQQSLDKYIISSIELSLEPDSLQKAFRTLSAPRYPVSRTLQQTAVNTPLSDRSNFLIHNRQDSSSGPESRDGTVNSRVQSLQPMEHPKSELSTINLLLTLGKAQYEMKEYRSARHSIKKAITYCESSSNPNKLASAFHDLAQVYRQLDRIPKAIAACEQSIKCAKLYDQIDILLSSLGKLSAIYSTSQQPAKSITVLQQLAEMHRVTGQRQKLSDTLWKLGSEYSKLAEVENAFAACQESLQISREDGPPEVLAQHLKFLGQFCLKQGLADEAGIMFSDSLQIWQNLNAEAEIRQTESLLQQVYTLKK